MPKRYVKNDEAEAAICRALHVREKQQKHSVKGEALAAALAKELRTANAHGMPWRLIGERALGVTSGAAANLAWRAAQGTGKMKDVTK